MSIAAEWAGFTTCAFVERDKYCQRVLARHWPGVPIFDDVATVTADAVRDRCDADNGRKPVPDQNGNGAAHAAGRQEQQSRISGSVGLISAGFPCQPHSVAGKRKGSADERDLWSECARIVGEFRPRWCVFENVPGLLTSEGGRFFARILDDLAALGYVVTWLTYGAVDVGAPHRRDRVFIVAHAAVQRQRSGASESGSVGGCGQFMARPESGSNAINGGEDVADGIKSRLEGFAGHGANGNEPGRIDAKSDGPTGAGSVCDAEDRGQQRAGHEQGAIGRARQPVGTVGRLAQSSLGLLADGTSHWLDEPAGIPRVATGVKDRVSQLRALGNAVVWQQAYPIFKAIAEIEGMT